MICTLQSRDVKRDSDVQLKEANKYFAIESAIALLLSFIINLVLKRLASTTSHSHLWLTLPASSCPVRRIRIRGRLLWHP